jgi:hypothetical protein
LNADERSKQTQKWVGTLWIGPYSHSCFAQHLIMKKKALSTLGLWITSIAKEERVVCRDFSLALREGFAIQPSVSDVTEVLQDLHLVI